MNVMTISKDVQHMRIVTFWPMWSHEASGHFLLEFRNAFLVWLLEASFPGSDLGSQRS